MNNIKINYIDMKLKQKYVQTFEQFLLKSEDPNKIKANQNKSDRLSKQSEMDELEPIEDETPELKSEEDEEFDEMLRYFEKQKIRTK